MSRTAVVTGGGTGIGKAIAARLAGDGAHVVIVGRRESVLRAACDEINDRLGERLVSYQVADLLDPDQVEALAEHFSGPGSLDILVNNAGGVFGGAEDTLSDLAAAYRADFDGNVITAVLVTQALIDSLTRPGGRIVAISSLAALRGSGSYGTAKAAMHGWVMGLATALAPEGVTVNAVAPGFVPDTEFWADRLTEELVRSRLALIPANRAGTPQEVAEAVAYLASEQAGWTTGQILQVNGGGMLGRG
jgi:3-oxoacyl-[acyl-carrier protein] reductase